MAFPLYEADAHWLGQRIRVACVDASNRPRDIDALACLQLADLLAAGPRGHRFDPVEVTHSQARALTSYVLEPSAVVEHELQTLYDALLHFGADNLQEELPRDA
jgi:hypothetical protein